MAALVDESKKIFVPPRLGTKNLISPSGMRWKVSNNNTKISTFSYQPLLTTSDLLAC